MTTKRIGLMLALLLLAGCWYPARVSATMGLITAPASIAAITALTVANHGNHTMKRLAPLMLLTALTLSGCAGWDVHQVRNPQSKYSMIGMSVPDLIHCMGTDFTFKQTKPDEGEMMWTRKDNSTALKATLTLVGSVELGGGGGCSVSADILRDGTVSDIDFPQSYNDGLLAEPYHACRPLVIECIGHPSDTGLPKGYDAFAYLAPGTAEAKR